VTEAHVREQLAQGCYLRAERPEIEPATFSRKSNTLTTTQVYVCNSDPQAYPQQQVVDLSVDFVPDFDVT